MAVKVSWIYWASIDLLHGSVAADEFVRPHLFCYWLQLIRRQIMHFLIENPEKWIHGCDKLSKETNFFALFTLKNASLLLPVAKIVHHFDSTFTH